ncbi:MAG: SDR family oxidoreductase [Pseudomonadaceae bacterium]|nr:SDR family oxidoreductase [Pseudomonadaceae bacterium]
MDLKDKIVVVTGGAGGIGRAMAQAFANEGARHVAVADMNEAGAAETAAMIGGSSAQLDVSDEAAIKAYIDKVEAEIGPIDLFCSNAGIGVGEGLETPNDVWETIWQVNTMSHMYAARHLVPKMIARGGGYLLNTASAAGLLAQIGSITYSVTKAAAVAMAEWISITHGNDGIKVSVLCPQAVRTAMTAGGPGVAGVDGMMEADEVANVVVEGLRDERFLILPHPEVAAYVERKGTDRDRWLTGMRRLQERYLID